VGDIKKGGSSYYAGFCNDEIFSSRKDLFRSLESDIDFFMSPGDNEWNECDGYRKDPRENDRVKELWREYFVSGSFYGFDHSLPSGARPDVERQSGNSQNYFFYYDDEEIAFFGITQTDSSTSSSYDWVNADWVSSKLRNKSPKAVVIFGHATLSSAVRRELDDKVPTLYVQGNDHAYCYRFMDDNWLELTVDAYKSPPLIISIRKDDYGKHFFEVEDTGYGC